MSEVESTDHDTFLKRQRAKEGLYRQCPCNLLWQLQGPVPHNHHSPLAPVPLSLVAALLYHSQGQGPSGRPEICTDSAGPLYRLQWKRRLCTAPCTGTTTSRTCPLTPACAANATPLLNLSSFSKSPPTLQRHPGRQLGSSACLWPRRVPTDQLFQQAPNSFPPAAVCAWLGSLYPTFQQFSASAVAMLRANWNPAWPCWPCPTLVLSYTSGWMDLGKMDDWLAGVSKKYTISGWDGQWDLLRWGLSGLLARNYPKLTSTTLLSSYYYLSVDGSFVVRQENIWKMLTYWLIDSISVQTRRQQDSESVDHL